MRHLLLIVSAGAVSMLGACEAGPQGTTHPSVAAPSNESTVAAAPLVSPLLEGFDDLLEGGGADDGDCSRWIDRVDGGRICVDVLIAILMQEHPEDNDGDGIPNISDEDIDGDGIPNGYDLDVDGDGVPNGYDDDIDGDGVTNEFDVDIDGDFLRNRWDFDMDGDLLFNPRDPDADADGKLKYPVIPEFEEADCGAADNFRDPDECDLLECKEPSGTDNKENKCDDKGKKSGSGTENGQNKKLGEALLEEDPEEPTATELDLSGEATVDIFAEEGNPVDELMAADSDATGAEVLDALTESVESAIEQDDPDGTGALVEEMGDTADREYASRRRSIEILTDSADLDLATAADTTRMLADSANKLVASSLDELTDTIVEVDGHLPGTSIYEDGAVAARFHEISDEAGLIPSGVAPAVRSVAKISFEVEGEDDLEPAFQSIVDRTAEHEDENGGMLFTLPIVALAAERIAVTLDDPTIESLDESLGHLLNATEEFEVGSPLQVLDAMIDIAEADPSVSLADGISELEATRAAMEAAN